MRILQLYLIRQVLATLLMTVLVFAFVLMLGNVLKEVLGLLVNRQADPRSVLEALALLVPYVLVYALPMGLLTATLLVFGRFSADQELTAARANGISLSALVAPLLLLSLLFSGLCAWINFDIAPRSRLAYEKLLFRVAKSSSDELSALLPEGRYVKQFPGVVLYAGTVDGQTLNNVLFYRFKDNDKILDIRAPRATVRKADDKQEILLRFSKPRILFQPAAFSNGFTSTIDVGLGDESPEDGDADKENRSGSKNSPMRRSSQWSSIRSGQVQLAVQLPSARDFGNPSLEEMTLAELLRERDELRHQGIDTTPVLVQIHRQAAFSFASIGFTLIGIPLGVRAHRRETTAGIAIAIVLVALYYGFIILGQALETQSGYLPYVILWAPNFLFQSIGAFLLWRADQRS